MKQRMLRTVVAAAACSFLALAPSAHALPGDVVGFVLTDSGSWVPHIGDTSGWTGAACSPWLHADTYRPEFNNLTVTPTWMSMDETGGGSVYIGYGECHSQAVIGAFRMTDAPLYSFDPDSTGWKYGYGVDQVVGELALTINRTVVDDEPTFTGTTVIEAGAWWGKPDPVTHQMVYYPAGCVQQSWLYTIVAWTGTVEAQPLGPERPCAQPPLPGTPDIVL